MYEVGRTTNSNIKAHRKHLGFKKGGVVLGGSRLSDIYKLLTLMDYLHPNFIK